MDVEMRVNALSFSKHGILALPKHNKKFLDIEKKICELNIKLKSDEISNEEFLHTISGLLINENYYNVVKAACRKIEETPFITADMQNDLIEEASDIIFLNSASNARICKKFGEDWFNKF